MNILSYTEFHKLTAPEIQRVMPCIVKFNGEPIAIVADFNNTIDISEMHPWMKKKMRILETRARRGMPNPTVVNKEVVSAQEDEQILATTSEG
jgi:hypothetical protein